MPNADAYLLLVFVVDDEPAIATTLALILRNSGFSAMWFTNPLNALKAAVSDPPDVLVSDVAMPQLSGIDLAIQIRKVCPECIVLLISGQSSTLNLSKQVQARGYKFPIYAKPIDPWTLIFDIKKLASGRMKRSA